MRTIHLIRHGEVHNPDHVVYADLDGFGLSELGRQQARAAAARLAETDVCAVVHAHRVAGSWADRGASG